MVASFEMIFNPVFKFNEVLFISLYLILYNYNFRTPDPNIDYQRFKIILS